MSSDEQPSLELRWPDLPRAMAVLCAVSGFGYMGFLAHHGLRGEAVPTPLLWKLIFCALGPLGLGFLVSACQRVIVFPNRIENRHLGLRRTLDLPSTKVSKVVSNGFWIADASNNKIFIHKMMEGSQTLFSKLKAKDSA